MSKPQFKAGDTFKVDKTEFEVASVSTNDVTGVHVYEVLQKSDMDARRAADEKSATEQRLAAEKAAKEEADTLQPPDQDQ